MMAPSSNGGKNVSGDDVYFGFEELIQGCDVAVKAMVYRKWDVHNSFGKYLSTEFILSDSQVSCFWDNPYNRFCKWRQLQRVGGASLKPEFIDIIKAATMKKSC